MAETRCFRGRCHCGNLEVTFETRKSPEQLGVRACACSFCRQHGAHTTTDPDGRARIAVRDPANLSRYRFGLRTADFLVCRVCGVYLGAVYADGGRAYATINVNVLDERAAFPPQPMPAHYERESEMERRARRKARWTPVEALTEG